MVVKASEQINRQNNAAYNNKFWGDAMYSAPIYGVVSGGTDVTSKLQALIQLAISEGRRAIYFPAGEYYVTTLANTDQVDFFGDNASFTGGYDGVIRQMGDWASTAQLAEIAINVKTVGAKGDGVADDTEAIQKAIDDCAAKGGGVVFFPAGVYRISSTLIKRAKVSIVGAGAYASIITWTDIDGGIMLDSTNERLSDTNVENITFTKEVGVTGDVTGFLGGSDEDIYNSTGLTMRNARFLNLKYGVRGNGAADIGIFDSIFDNVTADGCYYGLWIHGSQNTIRYARIIRCEYGLVLSYLSNHSKAGVQVFGGIFVSNQYDIYVPTVQGTRPCLFDGVWFEASTHPVVTIDNPNTQLFTWTFAGCMLSSNNTTAVADFTNAIGGISVTSCKIFQLGSTYSTEILPPSTSSGYLSIIATWVRSYLAVSTMYPVDAVLTIGGGKKKEQTGITPVTSLTGSAVTTINVTFDVAFGATPYVFVQSGSGNRILCTVGNITPTGFSIFAYNFDSTASTQIRWLAKG